MTNIFFSSMWFSVDFSALCKYDDDDNGFDSTHIVRVLILMGKKRKKGKWKFDTFAGKVAESRNCTKVCTNTGRQAGRHVSVCFYIRRTKYIIQRQWWELVCECECMKFNLQVLLTITNIFRTFGWRKRDTSTFRGKLIIFFVRILNKEKTQTATGWSNSNDMVCEKAEQTYEYSWRVQ